MASDRDTPPDTDPVGPSEADLAAIEREWPLIEAELALLDTEIRALTAAGGPSALDRRRVRRAERLVLHKAFEFVAAEQRHPDHTDDTHKKREVAA